MKNEKMANEIDIKQQMISYYMVSAAFFSSNVKHITKSIFLFLLNKFMVS